jgi:hypothetical protein
VEGDAGGGDPPEVDAGASTPDAGVPAEDAGGPPTGGPPFSEWPYAVAGRMVALGGDLFAYNPHVALGHLHRGSGHTHCAPDHSGIAAATQEGRLRDMALGHDFLWMTAHNFVAPDPGVAGLEHMFGIEIYASAAPSGESPHMLAFLPDGSLASASAEPFGRYDHPMAEVIRRVVAAGGLPVLAHPTRYAPTTAEVVALPPELWAIEGISGGTDVDANLAPIDARLDAGRYTCISAGSDVHQHDYGLTSGYQVVSTPSAAANRGEIFEQVRACNFFACRTNDGSTATILDPRLDVEGGAIRFRAGAPVDRIELIGRGGAVLSTATASTEASYRPTGDERYVRVSATGSGGATRCLSQPVWLLRE